MEKYLNGVTIPLAISVAGGIIFVIYCAFKNTLDSVREKEVIAESTKAISRLAAS